MSLLLQLLLKQSLLLQSLLEEVSMIWIDRPSVAEMERGVYEMDGWKSAKNMEMPLK